MYFSNSWSTTLCKVDRLECEKDRYASSTWKTVSNFEKRGRSLVCNI